MSVSSEARRQPSRGHADVDLPEVPGGRGGRPSGGQAVSRDPGRGVRTGRAKSPNKANFDPSATPRRPSLVPQTEMRLPFAEFAVDPPRAAGSGEVAAQLANSPRN